MDGCPSQLVSKAASRFENARLRSWDTLQTVPAFAVPSQKLDGLKSTKVVC
jgi:hypothetical protein